MRVFVREDVERLLDQEAAHYQATLDTTLDRTELFRQLVYEVRRLRRLERELLGANHKAAGGVRGG